MLVLMLVGLSASEQATAETGSIISLETNTGRAFSVYAAGPKDANRGILLVHGWYGLNEQARFWADKFAAIGYRAMSIDLYDGKLATDSETARTYMNAVKQSEANEKYHATLKALQAPGRKLATIGWSFGGTQALNATLSAPEQVSATVMYYPFGNLVKAQESLAVLKGRPILLIRTKKEFPDVEKDTELFVVAAKEANITLREHTYNTKHGFTNPSAKHHDPETTEAAWKLTVEFLGSLLK